MSFRSSGASRWRTFTRHGDRLALLLLIAVTAGVVQPRHIAAQVSSRALSLDSAVHRAVRTHPAVAAARAALAAADARSRQAAVFTNPTLSWQYERTSRPGADNSQHITTLEQPLAFGQRGARRDAAGAEVRVVAAELREVELVIGQRVATAFAAALEADRRLAIADRSLASFTEAVRIVNERRAAGDASGYELRRLQLEAARYAAVREARVVESRRARRDVLALVDPTRMASDSGLTLEYTTSTDVMLADDSLVALGRSQRPDLDAAQARVSAGEAYVRLAEWERLPVPSIVGGLKTENAAGLGALRGIAAGLSVPLPLFDRRRGARDAADADVVQARLLLVEQQQRATLEILTAADAVRSIDRQIAALQPALGESAERALAAVQTAFAEGDISLDAWLFALRSYDEAEDAFATLRAEALLRRAELARAVGQPILS